MEIFQAFYILFKIFLCLVNVELCLYISNNYTLNQRSHTIISISLQIDDTLCPILLRIIQCSYGGSLCNYGVSWHDLFHMGANIEVFIALPFCHGIFFINLTIGNGFTFTIPVHHSLIHLVCMHDYVWVMTLISFIKAWGSIIKG